MTSGAERNDVDQKGFDSLLAARRGQEPSWLISTRERGMKTFTATGFPTTEHEEWRFTNVEPIRRGGFKLLESTESPATPEQVENCRFGWSSPIELVFVDGRFAPDLSQLKKVPRGVSILPLSHTVQAKLEWLRTHYAQYADEVRDPFVALNTAMTTEGAAIFVPRGTVVQEPIHFLFVSTANSAGTAFHPRNLIVVEESGQMAVVESYVATKDAGAYFTNAVTEVVSGSNSVVEHCMIELDSPAAHNVSTLRAEQHRNSHFTSHSVLVGGSLVRNNVHPVLSGEGCNSILNGLYVLNGRQHMDNFMRVEHAKPHGDSRQFYKGILDDESHGVFSGRIIVHKDAQKTDAKQTNRNLLLSDSAQVDTKPQLEIYADDVKCTHGATIGQVNSDAVFYLRSRGIPEKAARNLLVHAFAGESFARMKIDGLRDALERLVMAKLPRSESPEGSA